MEAILICVPTPLDDHREPDLSFVLETANAIAPYLPKGVLVVLESTTYPGTTEDELRLTLEDGSGMQAGIDFHLAYSPEREDPGRENASVKTIPKVVGGFTLQCGNLAETLYGQALDKVHRVSSCKAAEATKLLENIFRSVNIALVNELKVVYEAMGIDVHEVIDAAATKPFGYMAFRPGAWAWVVTAFLLIPFISHGRLVNMAKIPASSNLQERSIPICPIMSFPR